MRAGRRVCAAVTLDREGGGIAVASGLIWRVLRDRWPEASDLVTLIRPEGPAHGRLDAFTRLRFGARLGAAQALGRVSWILYSHLSLAKVQDWLPPGLRCPYAVFLHGIEAWRPVSATERRVLQGAALLISNSGHTAQRIREAHPWIGPIAECALALPHVPESSPSTPALPDHGPRRSVIIVGRMSAAERYKGHDQVLEAWRAVSARVAGARLFIVGEGDDVPRLREKAIGLALGNSVVFTGFVPDARLEQLYQEAALLAMPSLGEGFGLVYLEAMARGLPCIGSVHDAAGDVIVDGVTGHLVEQGDIAALTGRIVHLLLDEGVRADMGARGRRRVEEQFSYARFEHRLLSLLAGAFEEAAPVAVDARSPRLNLPPQS